MGVEVAIGTAVTKSNGHCIYFLITETLTVFNGKIPTLFSASEMDPSTPRED